MKRALVTGASGFIGQVLCRRLLQQSIQVTGIDKYNPGHTALDTGLPPVQPQSFIQIDLDSPDLADILAGLSFDAVFHLAGRVSAVGSVAAPELDFRQNLGATFKLLDTLRKNAFSGRFVYASSASVYGEPRKMPITETTRARPISPYGASKLATEKYIRVFAQSYGFSAVIARMFSVYGAGQKKQVVFDVLRKALHSDRPIELFGNGSEVRDFIYVEDAVQAILALTAQAEADAPVFNICSGRGITIRELAELIVSLAGEDPQRIVFSLHRRAGDPVHWVGSNKKLLGTGFSLKYDMPKGLAETQNWFKETLIKSELPAAQRCVAKIKHRR